MDSVIRELDYNGQIDIPHVLLKIMEQVIFKFERSMICYDPNLYLDSDIFIADDDKLQF